MNRREFVKMCGVVPLVGSLPLREQTQRPTEPDVGQVWLVSEDEPRPWAGDLLILHSLDMSTQPVSHWTEEQLNREPCLRTPGKYWWGCTSHMLLESCNVLCGSGHRWLHEEEEILPGIRSGRWKYLGNISEFLQR